ncbi:MAG TPA: c-type cytochrome [Bryobacteraceae bacterium]|nr:c-type cytochrome [Bryobacteraceae bacterium]
MKTLLIAFAGGAALFFVMLYGQTGRSARGRYLVDEVAKCQECHTPRLKTGELDGSAWLKGGPGNAPDVTAGGELWKHWGERGMFRFLVHGVNPEGKPARPPMPAYKLRPDDAEAMVAYLKSLR